MDRAERHKSGAMLAKEIEVVFVVEGKRLIACYSDANLFSRLTKHWSGFRIHLQSTFQIHELRYIQALIREVGKSIDQVFECIRCLAFLRCLQPEVSLWDGDCRLSRQAT